MRVRADHIKRFIEYLAAAILALISILVCVQVFFRYVLLAPLTWSEELVRFLFVWLSFLGAAICFWRGGHFKIDFVTRAIPEGIARQIRIVVDCLVLIFVGFLIYEGFAILRMAFLSQYIAIEMSLGWSYLAVPVCSVIMVPFVISDIFRNLRE